MGQKGAHPHRDQQITIARLIHSSKKSGEFGSLAGRLRVSSPRRPSLPNPFLALIFRRLWSRFRRKRMWPIRLRSCTGYGEAGVAASQARSPDLGDPFVKTPDSYYLFPELPCRRRRALSSSIFCWVRTASSATSLRRSASAIRARRSRRRLSRARSSIS